MNVKVCKFGGSSVKDASQIRKVFNIIKSDEKRKVIVVSAPGRDEKYNEKITDHLLNLSSNGTHFCEQKIDVSSKQSLEAIIEKFEKLCEDLKIEKKSIIESLSKDLKNSSLKGEKRDAFFLSRGEH